MRHLIALLILFSGSVHAWGQLHHTCPHHDHAPAAWEHPLYEKWLSAYDVKGYHIDLAVSNRDTRISGSASILVEALRDVDTLLFELQDSLHISGVLCSSQIGDQEYRDKSALEFVHKDNAVTITLDRTLNAGDLLQIRISYGGIAGPGRSFFAGVSSKTDRNYGADVTYTLSEPLNAKKWLPVKQIQEDKIDSVTFRIRCNRELRAASNGVLIGVEPAGEEHVFTWKTNYPMAYYLLSFAVADYRDFSFKAPLSREGDSVLVQNYIYDDDRVLTRWEDEIRMTGPLITTFSKLLVDYPFAEEKYGHAMAPMGGGMEHQTMTTLDNFGFFLVAHELAHQWFGNWVTCATWQDIWINEGLTSYMEYVAAQELLGQDKADQWMSEAISIARRKTTGSVFVPPDRIEDSFRLFSMGLTYKKGAILVHMIRYLLDDDDLFFTVLRSYLAQYKNGTATAEDFRTVLESVSGRDFSCFFEQWYYGEGYPRFNLTWKQRGDELKIVSKQTTTAPDVTSLFQIPFELDLLMADGSTRRIKLMQSSNKESYTIPVGGPVVEIIFDPGNHLLETHEVVKK
ncbi:MAG: M1 family metallopeptidase [Bacteroidota bacterium]